MRASFWDAMHEGFEDEVFDPVGSDVRGVFRKALRAQAEAAGIVCDYGCGTVTQVPLLASN